MRYDYLKRLADGTTSMANENMERYHTDLHKEYPEAMGAQYLDGVMLAIVVRSEVLPLAQNDFGKMIKAIETSESALHYFDDEFLAELKSIKSLLQSLKESTRGMEDE